MNSTVLGNDHRATLLTAKLLAALCAAVASHPRATMQELAERVGISRATLHRFCGTRANLDHLLEEHTKRTLQWILRESAPQTNHPLQALQQLIHDHLAHGELIIFLSSRHHPCRKTVGSHQVYWQFYLDELDAFFLRGQHLGVFCINLTAPLLTEIFITTLYGAIDSRQRGRIPSNCDKIMENFFLQGIASHTPSNDFKQARDQQHEKNSQR